MVFRGYVLDYFLVGCNDLLESLLVSWQSHGDGKTPGLVYIRYVYEDWCKTIFSILISWRNT